MHRRPLRLLPTSALLSAAALLLAVSACAPEEQAPATAASASPASCTKDQLATLKPGTFTVGTDKPAYGPWFSDDEPSNGKGFESAVAYAVAGKLGFAQPDVKWQVVSFNQATAPGPKTFDVDINQISHIKRSFVLIGHIVVCRVEICHATWSIDGVHELPDESAGIHQI